MLDKSISVRCNSLWLSWLDRLSTEAGKLPSEFLRDMVYSLILAEDAGQSFAESMKSEQISFNG